MAEITPETVEYVAQLARLRLTDEEKARMTEDMGKILAYMDQLNALDTSDVAPMMHALTMTNVFREDDVAPGLTRETVLALAPVHNGEHILVPQILEQEEP
jgi:aspartyl-tRNA(Asn)/glutamyl-tRNA(Gln) amidotransferase subunit C